MPETPKQPDVSAQLAAALERANQVVQPNGTLNLTLRLDENVVHAPREGITGFGGREFTLLTVDANHNGRRNDPQDRLVVAAGGMIFTADMRGGHAVLDENPELAAQIQRSFKKLAHDVRSSGAQELGHLASTAIRNANAQEQQEGQGR